MKPSFAAALSLALLAGCATTIDMSRPPPADWPKLEVKIARVTDAQARMLCPRNNDIVISYNACTIPAFAYGTCNIYLVTADPDVLAHERMHCLGYDHPGESTLRDAWAAYKRSLAVR